MVLKPKSCEENTVWLQCLQKMIHMYDMKWHANKRWDKYGPMAVPTGLTLERILYSCQPVEPPFKLCDWPKGCTVVPHGHITSPGTSRDSSPSISAVWIGLVLSEYWYHICFNIGNMVIKRQIWSCALNFQTNRLGLHSSYRRCSPSLSNAHPHSHCFYQSSLLLKDLSFLLLTSKGYHFFAYQIMSYGYGSIPITYRGDEHP